MSENNWETYPVKCRFFTLSQLSTEDLKAIIAELSNRAINATTIEIIEILNRD